jgi:hypothetical protein
MEIVYRNTVEDLVGFQLYHYAHSPRSVRLQMLVMLAPAVAVLVLVWLASRQVGGSTLLALGGMVLAMALALALQGFMRRRLQQTARRSYASGRGKRTLGEHRLKVTDAGLVERAKAGEFTTPWSRAIRVIETEAAVYIYTARDTGLVIPRERVTRGDVGAFAAAVRARAASV